MRTHPAIFVGNGNATWLTQTNAAKSVLEAGWSSCRTMLKSGDVLAQGTQSEHGIEVRWRARVGLIAPPPEAGFRKAPPGKLPTGIELAARRNGPVSEHMVWRNAVAPLQICEQRQ